MSKSRILHSHIAQRYGEACGEMCCCQEFRMQQTCRVQSKWYFFQSQWFLWCHSWVCAERLSWMKFSIRKLQKAEIGRYGNEMSLSEESFPTTFKHALVKPLRKKHNLPQDELSSHRSVIVQSQIWISFQRFRNVSFMLIYHHIWNPSHQLMKTLFILKYIDTSYEYKQSNITKAEARLISRTWRILR